MAAAPRYFPAVGALVGLSGAAVLGATALVLPPLVALLLSVAATLAMTGALHDYGLAVTVDGRGSATPAAALEVMPPNTSAQMVGLSSAKTMCAATDTAV